MKQLTNKIDKFDIIQPMNANAKIITQFLINYLDKKYSNKTITTEISVNTTYGTKIADIVLSNGHSIAFEIKSELDTLNRLNSQINGFCEIFDYVYVVYWGERFNIQSLYLPEHVGAFKAYWNNNKIVFKKMQNAKFNRNIKIRKLVNLFWKSELEFFLKPKNISIKSTYDKSKLIDIFMHEFTTSQIKKIFRFILKKRFEKGFKKFKCSSNLDQALSELTKHKIDKDYLKKITYYPIL